MRVVACILTFTFIGLFISCQPNDRDNNITNGTTDNNGGEISEEEALEIAEHFNGHIDLQSLENYANQGLPNYITKDNTLGNPISNAGSTLGRILFYDKQLSADNTVSCATCHKQDKAFGDDDILSEGVAGKTGRHSMRLINARFAEVRRFFWDKRAATLEDQTTMPIQDHIEMGFSGDDGDPSIDILIDRLQGDLYYPRLFEFVYDTDVITEERMQESLAQFIRSIQSFDSKYDEGRSQVNNNNQNFPNYTTSENRGKELFMRNPQFANGNNRVGGGLGCQRCHSAPEFDIAPNSRNNGVIVDADSDGLDTDVTRSPTLRNMFDLEGNLLSPLMHTGTFTINDVLDHYNEITTAGNPNLDNRLRQGNQGQRLNLTVQERTDVIAFMKTLSGSAVSTDDRWSDPFRQ